MTEVAGVIHLLVLIGLTGAWLEQRVRNWPQWTAAAALLTLLVATIFYAGAIAIGYGAM